MQLQNVEQHSDHLAINLSGSVSRFHFFWLRDNAPQCRSRNGQKLHETNTLDPGVTPVAVEHTADSLTVDWSDGQRHVYPAAFLETWAYDETPAPAVDGILWARDIGDRVRSHHYDAVRDDAAKRLAWLRDVAIYGFGILHGVPVVEETIFDVVGLFGYVRDTNYGRLFEVRAEENASNLAYTPQPLSVHTDNPYRAPCPSLQLLHCLVQAEEGGMTALTDGFHAAECLRRESPGAFDLLATHEVSFHYESEDAVLDNRATIIDLDTGGRVKCIRINNRSIAPLRLPFDDMLPFYEALAAFRAILESEESQYRFRMQPGDLVIFDNERVLHGRAGESVGKRHLQGCYADRDGLLSTLRVLERQLG